MIMALASHSEDQEGGGRMVLERLKRLARSDDDGGTEYECKGCERGFEMQRQVCPDCGGYRIERADW